MAENRYIKVAYRMQTNTAASHKLLYESTDERPDAFVTGMGLMLDKFEENIIALKAGQTFNFTLAAADAFGEHVDEKVVELPRSTFEINGKFDAENIYEGVEVPLMDNEGNHFPGTVVKVTKDTVIVDLNDPLSGYAIQFMGTVIENREPTLQEIEQTAKILNGESCCGGCGGCGGGNCEGGDCEGGNCAEGKSGCCGGCQ